MGVVYRATERTARMQVILDAIDGGTLEIGTAAMASVLASITLPSPAGTLSGDTITLTMPQSDPSADNSGTAAAARIKNSGGAAIVTGLTAGTSGTNVVLDSVSFTAGQTFTLNSGTITHNTSGT